jgi:hypothetical protein
MLISGIKLGTTSIVSVLSNLSKYDSNSNIKEIHLEIKKMDLEFILNVIHQLINDLSDNDLNNTPQQDIQQQTHGFALSLHGYTNTIKIVLHGINDVITKIDNELQIFKNECDNYNNKYFSSWRSFNYDIKPLIEHHKLLLSRYNILISLLQIKN